MYSRYDNTKHVNNKEIQVEVRKEEMMLKVQFYLYRKRVDMTRAKFGLNLTSLNDITPV